MIQPAISSLLICLFSESYEERGSSAVLNELEYIKLDMLSIKCMNIISYKSSKATIL